MINLTIDNSPIEVAEGLSVLEACKQAGIKIPTLCYLEKIQAIGACRVCLVEIEGVHDLVASCVMPVSEGMKVSTNNRRVREARKVVVELLLSEHDGDCQTCDRNEDCELQNLAHDLGIKELRYEGEKALRCKDNSMVGLVRDSAKCISCRRCVTVCTAIQSVSALFPQSRGFKTTIGPAFAQNLDTVTCVQCGQCAAVCPVGAISERDQTDEVWAALDDPTKTVVVQTAPAIRAALGECFGMEPGTLVTGKMTTALRRMGFDAVFDTNFSADLTIMEEGTELLTRLKKALVDKEDVALPMFTSCSPGWIQFMEYFYPDMLPNLSTCKSPQQMMGAMVKTYYAQKLGKKPEEMFMVSVMPCTAKKFEAARAEMNSSGVQDVDVVLTTRELGKMITQAGIDFQALEDSEMDAPLGLGSGAADIFANTGGVMEAALRTAYELVTGRELPFDNLHVTPVAGLDGIKEAEITIEGTVPAWSFLEGVTAKIAVVHTLGNARKLIERIRAGEASYHFVEVMTCPGGCIGGGGQPRITTDEVRKKRIAAIYAEDEGKTLRKSHENEAVAKLYEDFLGAPLGHLSHELLHTKYTEKERV
ncbi:MAG: iron hydrogenase small subunit [Kiritimatiellales bacterium]|nr:iron hydrogenase small subunit [Kiritimatiellota bacterium]MBL7011384.1 iron hydrogenase small subunit [Kiritimatiellales bacterium]